MKTTPQWKRNEKRKLAKTQQQQTTTTATKKKTKEIIITRNAQALVVELWDVSKCEYIYFINILINQVISKI